MREIVLHKSSGSAGLTPPGDGVPRRVLMTLDAVGGVWRYALDLCKGLEPHGLEFILVGLGPQPSGVQEREAQSLRNASMIWLDEPLDWLAEHGGRLNRVPGRLCDLGGRYAVDLMHLNLPSQAAGLEAECPVIVVSHSCVVTWWQAMRDSPLPQEWVWQRDRNRAGLDAADAVLAPSRSHAEMLQACYGPIERMTVVANACVADEAPAPKEPLAFAAGRWWDEGKNGSVLDEAAQSVQWPVLMAGSCRSATGQAFTGKHARMLGELPGREVRELMARAGIVVSPSLYEPFGLAALEGARAGAALVLADIPTYREFWDGAALFAEPRDPGAFAGAINALAADPEMRADLGGRAKTRAERFSLEAQAEAMLEVYRTPAQHSLRPLAAAE